MIISRSLEDMSIEELLGEAIMPRLQIESYCSDPIYRTTVENWIRDHQVGGFCVFGGTPDLVRSTLDTLQGLAIETSGIPLLISCDLEYGLPMRLTSGGTEFPDAMAIGMAGSTELAREVGEAIATEMLSLGIHWNFAPVADINSNPRNPIINTRSFGETASVVSDYARAYANGIRNAGGLNCLKHFPGHGDTAVDSHLAMPVIRGSLARFDELELQPFIHAEGVADAIMLGHIDVPDLVEELGGTPAERNLPATLSKVLIEQLIRRRMRFDGVVVTDALEMHAITDGYGDAEAPLLAYRAGVDVLLLPRDVKLAWDRLIAAYRDGTLSEDHILKSARRLRTLKERSTVRRGELDDCRTSNEELANNVARSAIRATGGPRLEGANLLVLCDGRGPARSKSETFAREVRMRVPNEVQVMTPADYLEKKPHLGEDVVIATFHRARGYINGIAEKETVPYVLSEILKSTSPRGAILFGSPYLAELFESSSWQIKTFSESLASINAVIGVLFE